MIEDLGIYSDFEHRAWGGVPHYMRPGISNYIMHGVAPGSFLCAVLKGDLFEALKRADDTNINCLRDYGVFLYNHAPASSYGTPAKFVEWVRRGGINGTPQDAG